MVNKAWPQECQAGGYIVSTVGRQREMRVGARLPCSFLFRPGASSGVTHKLMDASYKGYRACPPVRDHQGNNSLQARVAGPFLSGSQPPKRGENNSASLYSALHYRTTKQPWTETSDLLSCCVPQPGAGLPTTLHLRPLRVSVLPTTLQVGPWWGRQHPSLGETHDG